MEILVYRHGIPKIIEGMTTDDLPELLKDQSAVTLVSLRTISPSQSFSAACNSAGASPGRFSTSKPEERSGPSPLSLTSSATKILVVIGPVY